MDVYYYFVYFISEYLVFLLAFYVFYNLRKDSHHLLSTFFALFASFLIAESLKYIIFTPRPLYPLLGSREGGSFPSTHTTISFAMAVSLFIKNKSRGTFALVMAFFVALGRVLGGAHFPIDTIAGGFIGVLNGIIFSKLNIYLKVKLNK